MSWEEFKKKKKNETNERILNGKDDADKTVSSWQKFKEEKEKLNKTSVVENKENDKKSILDNAGYISKNLEAGFKGSLTGAAKSVTTEIQNNLEKGENEKKNLPNFIGALGKSSNPGSAIIMDTIESGKKLLADKERSIPQKIVKAQQDFALSLLNNSIPYKRQIDEVIQMIGQNNPDAKSIIKNIDQEVSEPYNKLKKEIAEESQQYSETTQLFGNVANVVGNMGLSIGLTAVTKNPTIGLATIGVSAKGQATQEALDKGKDLDEAIKIGNTKGMIEVGTEMLTGGVNIFGKGALDDIVEKGIMNKVKSKVGRFLAKEGYDFAGEVGEETISDVLNTIVDKGTVDPNAKYSVSDFEDTAVVTILSTAVLKALGVPLNKAMNKNVENQTRDSKTENEQKVYDSEIQTRKNGKIRNTTIENAYQQQIKTQKKLGVEITEEVKNKIRQNVEKAYDTGILKSIELKKKELLKLEQEVEEDMQNGNISMENIMNILGENQDISKDNLLMRSAYENEQKYNSYQFEKTDNEKVNNLLQSAVDSGMNNTRITRKKIELLSKLVRDTDKQYKFVSPEQLRQMGYNENANGLIDKSTGEVLINNHTESGIQAIVGHETTHLFDGKDEKGNNTIEYQALQDMAIEYAKAKGIYDSKIRNITEAYGDLLVDEGQVKEELTADLVGDFLFNDEKFIEHLAIKDKNIFQKIYDYVKHTYKMITAKTDDAKALEKMKYQFDKVYKSVLNENNADIKYHISKNFSNEIEKSLDGKITSNNQIKARDYTPQILVENGVKDLPMLLTQKHLRQIVYTKEQAQKLGYNVKPKDHYHGLGKDTLIKAIDNMDSPQEIYQQTDTNYLIITEIKDENNNQIIVPVRIDGTGTYNNIDILENQISSVYGRKNLEKYINDNNFKRVYKKNRSNNNNEGVKSHDTIDTSITSITPLKKEINTNIKYSMQESENNSGSFSLDKNTNEKYSMTKSTQITGDDIAVKDMLKQERPTIEDEIGELEQSNKSDTINTEDVQNPEGFQEQSENTLNEEVEQRDVSENKAKTNLKTKARNYINRSKSKLKRDIVFKFGTSKYANTKLLNETVSKIEEDIRNGELNEEKTEGYFNELYENLKKVDIEYYEEHKELKKEIQNTKFYIPDSVKNSIADYNEFRQRNMGNIIMTNNPENVSIAGRYAELRETYPYLFPELSNETEMLEKIVDVSKDIKKVETNVSAYNDQYLGKEYRIWAKEEFKASLGDFKKDIFIAMRYNAETTLKEKQSITKEQAKELYKAIPEAKKKYERALAKEVLTREDKVQVDRLVNGEIDIGKLPKDSNKEGIIRVATAKSKYNTIQKNIDKYVKGIKEARLEEAEKDVGDLSLWKDKKSGWRYSRETPIRNIYDIAPKDVAKRVVNKYFRSYIEVNEKKVVDFINKYNDRVRTLKIDTNKKYKLDINEQELEVTESGLIQLLGEKKINIENIKEAGANADKIEKCVNEFRNIYNELIERINDSMLENGYAPMEYRKDYFPHFTEGKPDTRLEKVAKLFGIDITNEELPTDISGQTMNFKPGRTWFGNMLRRTADVTDYDVLKGFDKYIRGATDLIYHTNDIQNLRTLSKVIRGTYNDTEIQNRIAEIEESTDLDIFEKAERITEIKNTAKDKSHLSKFVEWLDNYTNLLAGKKAINDRGAEKELNRKMYKSMQNIESRFAANAIGGNIGVAVSNIGPVAQAVGETRPDYIMRGLWDTAKYAIIKDESFASTSSFIVRRRGTDYLSQTTTDKVVGVLTKPLDFVDEFVSESLVRAKYRENLDKGISEQVALEKADQYVAGLMADRGRGALPTKYSNKNPVAKMINMFQVEVNNQWSYYFKDLPKNLQEDGKKSLAFAFTKIMVGSYLMNNLIESIRGSRVLFDPIYIVQELIQGLSDDDDDNDADAIWNALTNILGNIPGVSLPATVLGIDDVGKVPITGMVPDLKDMIGNVTDVVNNEKSLKQGVVDIGKELLNTVGSSLILPIGGAQIKKSIKGISQYSSDKPVAGSYNENGDLKYSVDTDIGSKIKSFVFGASANPYAQDYVDSGYKAIKKDNINEMIDLDMNSTEYRQYKKELSNASSTKDKNGYEQYVDENGTTYWYDSDTKTMYNKNYKKTSLTADDLTQVSKTEEVLNYINGLDLTNSQKTKAANNLVKNSKINIDMSEYGKYSSYKEYKYARDYPEKYNVISQITDYDSFEKYKEDISNIKKQYSTEAGYESKERKKAIQSYINDLDLDVGQKMMLEKMAGGYNIKKYKNSMREYLESTDLSEREKYNIWNELFE